MLSAIEGPGMLSDAEANDIIRRFRDWPQEPKARKERYILL
jgi:hypothetical protein